MPVSEKTILEIQTKGATIKVTRPSAPEAIADAIRIARNPKKNPYPENFNNVDFAASPVRRVRVVSVISAHTVLAQQPAPGAPLEPTRNKARTIQGDATYRVEGAFALSDTPTPGSADEDAFAVSQKFKEFGEAMALADQWTADGYVPSVEGQLKRVTVEASSHTVRFDLKTGRIGQFRAKFMPAPEPPALS